METIRVEVDHRQMAEFQERRRLLEHVRHLRDFLRSVVDIYAHIVFSSKTTTIRVRYLGSVMTRQTRKEPALQNYWRC